LWLEARRWARERAATARARGAEGLLTDCWRDFRGLQWRWHLAALATLLCVLAADTDAILHAPAPTIDEAVYEAAFAAVLEGRSPYTAPGYFYPPAFASAGAWSVEALGSERTRLLLRWMNRAGAALTCWLASAWWWSSGRTVRSRVTERLLLALVLLLVAPGVGAGLLTGNVSLAASSWINLALHSAHAWPALSGTVLGASLLAKPLAVIAVPLLAGAALAPRANRKISPSSVIAACAVSSAGLLLLPHFSEMLTLKIPATTLAGTVSLVRVAGLLGFELPAGILMLLLAPLAFLAGRAYATDRVALICSALALVMFTSPAIWPYTATVFFPVPVMAISVARSRFAARTVASREGLLELLLVGALAIAVLFLNGGAFDRLAPAVQVALLLAQLAAPVLLAGYVLRSVASWEKGAAADPPAPSTDRLPL
jgi:hypothetical protein